MTRPKIFFLTLLSLAGCLLGACADVAFYNPAAPTAEAIQPAPTSVVPTLAESPLSAYHIPPYYSPTYSEIVNGSKNEAELVIYFEFSRDQWRSVIQTFNHHYPWINVKIITQETSSSFKQYDNDISLQSPTADIIMSTDTISWFEFLLRGEIQAYQSEENLYLPLWATKNSGLYPINLDPAVTVYYKNLVSTPPINLLALSNIIRRSPETYQQRIATTNAELNPEAFLVNWFWIKAKGESGWELLRKISQIQPVIFDNKDELVQNIIRSSVRIGYFVPASSVLPEKKRYTNLEYSYIMDGQPIYMNYMGITNVAAHPNSAKLLLDFLLSQDGQIALAQDGMMPYRSDVAGILDYHLEILENQLGTENLIFMDIDPALTKPENISYFLEQWRAAYGRQPASK